MKKHFLSFVFVLCAIGSYATTVAVSDAQNVALNFFKLTANTSETPTATLQYTKTTGNVVDFYVFDMSPATGFVIIAGDDNIIPILAYSTESRFNVNFNHTGVGVWISQTASVINQALQRNTLADARISGQWTAYRLGQSPNVQRTGNYVGPLCTTMWDQENENTESAPYLYDLFCPYNATDSQRAVTGCVATAQAQVMKYWNYPTQGSGSFGYQCEYYGPPGPNYNYGYLSSDFSAHTYQWSLMPNTLGNSSDAADTAVSQLMYDCGISVGMQYGDDNEDGSGAAALLSYEFQNFGDSLCSQTGLVWYFGYDNDSIRGIYRSNYTDSAWIAIMENEMNMGRPVMYEGDDSANPLEGHCWVCDGYNTSDQLHMNWGWGGYADGYFSVGNLTTPGNPPFNPILQNDALIGIQPPPPAAAGIKTVANAFSFKVFPNPASNDVVLQTSETLSGSTWEFRNIIGQSVIEGSIDGLQTHVNTAGLAPGVYFVEIHTGAQTAIRKLVISRQ